MGYRYSAPVTTGFGKLKSGCHRRVVGTKKKMYLLELMIHNSPIPPGMQKTYDDFVASGKLTVFGSRMKEENGSKRKGRKSSNHERRKVEEVVIL